MTQVPELLTVAEVAEKLRLSDETVHRWARLGKLPYVDVLGVKRFRSADIQAILNRTGPVEDTVPPGTPTPSRPPQSPRPAPGPDRQPTPAVPNPQPTRAGAA